MSACGHAIMPTAACVNASIGAFGNRWLQARLGWQLLDTSAVVGQSAIMTLSMVPPLLLRPMHGLWYARAAPEKKAAVTLSFVLAYVGVWGPCVVLLTLVAYILASVFRSESVPLCVFVVCAAVAWSATPARQHCQSVVRALDLHNIGSLPLNALQAGVRHGWSCIGTCWVLMLVTLLGGRQHGLFMGVTMVILAVERNEAPKRKRADPKSA